MQFGEKLQALRKARGWSQEELARQINVSRQALSKWESGAAVPDTENVVALSRLFGVTTDYLLLEEGTSVQSAPVIPAGNRKWPGIRVAWLFIFLIGAAGLIALRIWASVTGPYSNGYSHLTGLSALNARYNLSWLTLLVQAMFFIGGIATIFYHRLRRLWHEDILMNDKK
ncbi:MAG: helix-turn-helix domain-containing protein [Vescimonas sp.]